MFSLESKEVRNMNLRCLQTLNELCDSVELLYNGLSHLTNDNVSNPDNNAQSIDILNPMVNIYDLSCFIRTNIEENDMNKPLIHDQEFPSNKLPIQLLNFKVKTPLILCSRQRVTVKNLDASLKQLLHSLTPIFNHTNLLNPFQLADNDPLLGGRKQNRVNNNPIDGSENNGLYDDIFHKVNDKELNELQKQIDIRGYEMSIRNRRQRQMFQAFQGNKNFHGSSSRRQRNLIKTKACSRGISRDVDDDDDNTDDSSTPTFVKEHRDINDYLTSGNVLVRDLTLLQEIESIGRLKQFFIDFHMNINFDYFVWKMIIIVICPSKSKAINQSSNGNSVNHDTFSTTNVANNSKAQYKSRLNNQLLDECKVTKDRQFTIIEITTEILNKPKLLLNLIGSHINFIDDKFSM